MLANLGLAASMALVATANAILLPPQLAADALGDDLSLETFVVDPSRRTVALECPGCPKATVEDHRLQWTPDVGNSFVLDFHTGPFQDTLEIDEVQLYPPTFGFVQPFEVTQLDPSNTDDEPLRLVVTGYTFQFDSAETISEDGNELLPMKFRITSIESHPVQVPALTIYLLKDVTGRLMIASFESRPVEEKQEDCNEWPLYCKWKSILSDKFGDVKDSVEGKIKDMKNTISKGCHKNKGNPMMPEGADITEGAPQPQPGHHHPHHRPHHGGHGHHHHRHSSVAFLIYATVVNVLIGVFIGASVFLSVRVLGYAIAFLVNKARGRSAYEAVDSDDDEEADEAYGEKEVYAPVPEYEALPNYEEAAEKQVVDDSH